MDMFYVFNSCWCLPILDYRASLLNLSGCAAQPYRPVHPRPACRPDLLRVRAHLQGLLARRFGMEALAASSPSSGTQWACHWPHPCRPSCPALRSRPPHPECRPPPGRPRPVLAIVGQRGQRRARSVCALQASPMSTLPSSSAPVLRRCISRSCASAPVLAHAGQVDGLAAGHALAAAAAPSRRHSNLHGTGNAVVFRQQ